MRFFSSIAAVVMAALALPVGAAKAADGAAYPDWKGQWNRRVIPGLGGQVAFDQTRPWGPGQGAPLTPEYQEVLKDSLADQTAGGLGNYSTSRCLPGGMPRMMTAFQPLEYIIKPHTTYILVGNEDHWRRIYTDGRDWPASIDPTYQGYSIGRWIDEDGDGHYDVLEVETRGPFKGPRAYDASGLPLDFDNQSIFKERFYIDKNDANLLHDELTVIDHALTRPWTVDKQYRRTAKTHLEWSEFYCTENAAEVTIGKENYFLSGDGMLMPARKDQPAPDLRYFKQTKQTTK